VAHPDYEEFLAAFNEHGVRYLIGGAHALGSHARPRATRDLGVFIAPTSAILSKLGAGRFQDAWKRRVDARYGTVPAHYLSLEDLIREKEHWRRAQDIADLEDLRRVRPRPR
jgi:hypothetical protein